MAIGSEKYGSAVADEACEAQLSEQDNSRIISFFYYLQQIHWYPPVHAVDEASGQFAQFEPIMAKDYRKVAEEQRTKVDNSFTQQAQPQVCENIRQRATPQEMDTR